MLETWKNKGREVTPYLGKDADGNEVMIAQCPFCHESFSPVNPEDRLECSEGKGDFYVGYKDDDEEIEVA